MMGNTTTICSCPICRLRANLTLLETGRPYMALTVLKGWQEEMMATMPDASMLPGGGRWQGREEAQRAEERGGVRREAQHPGALW